MPDVSFLNLIERCKNGDRAAQKELYEDHFGFAMAISVRYCKSKEEALEVLNDSFMKVFKNLHKFKPSLSFKSWLKRILINTSIDFYRNQQKHYYHHDISSAYDQSSNTASPDSNLAHTELLELLKELPNSYRISFTMFAIEGYSHQEIAEAMGISVGTSKSNVSRARDILRQKLAAISVEVPNRK